MCKELSVELSHIYIRVYAIDIFAAARSRGGFDKAQAFINGLMFEACLPMGASKTHGWFSLAWREDEKTTLLAGKCG